MMIDVLAGLAAVSAVTVLVLAMRRPPRVAVDVGDGALRVRFSGWDVLWTVRRSVTLPLGQITRVDVAALADLPRRWMLLRVGTAMPDLIRAGSYGRGDSRELWDVRTADEVVCIECRPGGPYRRIVLQLPDPRATAARLRSALSPVPPCPGGRAPGGPAR